MIDKDVLLILIGSAGGFLSAMFLALLNSWLSRRAERLKRIQEEADERVALVLGFLSGGAKKKNDDAQAESLPKVAWLVLDQYTGPRKFSLRKLNLVTQRILPLSETLVILRDITTIGRDSINHLVLNSSEVNKVHAIVRLEVDKYVLYDLSGTKGLQVNGERANRAILADGDRIEIQGFIIIYAERESTIKESLILVSDQELRAVLGNR